jgi:hypothetical protein
MLFTYIIQEYTQNRVSIGTAGGEAEATLSESSTRGWDASPVGGARVSAVLRKCILVPCYSTYSFMADISILFRKKVEECNVDAFFDAIDLAGRK